MMDVKALGNSRRDGYVCREGGEGGGGGALRHIVSPLFWASSWGGGEPCGHSNRQKMSRRKLPLCVRVYYLDRLRRKAQYTVVNAAKDYFFCGGGMYSMSAKKLNTAFSSVNVLHYCTIILHFTSQIYTLFSLLAMDMLHYIQPV